MKYPKEFVSFVGKVSSETNDSLKFIGQGNPNANILFLWAMTATLACHRQGGLDADYWYLAAEVINANCDVGAACWGKTKAEAVNKLKKALKYV
jgi:hypothetical protein